MKHGILTVDLGNGKIQYWFISESKKRTYILITQEIKPKFLSKLRKKRKTKILDWGYQKYIGWWLND